MMIEGVSQRGRKGEGPRERNGLCSQVGLFWVLPSGGLHFSPIATSFYCYSGPMVGEDGSLRSFNIISLSYKSLFLTEVESLCPNSKFWEKDSDWLFLCWESMLCPISWASGGSDWIELLAAGDPSL